MGTKIGRLPELIGLTIVADGTTFKVSDAYGRVYNNPNRDGHGEYMYSFMGFDENNRFVRVDVHEYEVVKGDDVQ